MKLLTREELIATKLWEISDEEYILHTVPAIQAQLRTCAKGEAMWLAALLETPLSRIKSAVEAHIAELRRQTEVK